MPENDGEWMEFNSFVRRKAPSSVTDTDNVWTHSSQIDPFKFTFMINTPRNGGQSTCPGTLKLLKRRLGLSRQKWLALTGGQQPSLQERGTLAFLSTCHRQESVQERTGSGNPSVSTCGHIVRPLASTYSQGTFLLTKDQDRNQA